jgi:hypothetical protein
MTEPAPYTPSTLRAIKAGACASDLGWPQSRYERVCREHGFTIKADVTLPPVLAAPQAKMPEQADITWNEQECSFVAGRASVAIIGRARRSIVRQLVASYLVAPDAYMSEETICKGMGRNAGRLSHAVGSVRAIIAQTGWTIESRYTKPGGYRLARSKP